MIPLHYVTPNSYFTIGVGKPSLLYAEHKDERAKLPRKHETDFTVVDTCQVCVPRTVESRVPLTCAPTVKLALDLWSDSRECDDCETDLVFPGQFCIPFGLQNMLRTI